MKNTVKKNKEYSEVHRALKRKSWKKRNVEKIKSKKLNNYIVNILLGANELNGEEYELETLLGMHCATER